MAMINGTLVGIIGSDPVTRQVKDTTVTEIQVAYENRRAPNRPTEWLKVEIWGKLGSEVVGKYAGKGDQIAVTYNDIRTESFLTREGKPGAKTVLRASAVELIGGRRDLTSTNEPVANKEMPF